MKIYTVYPHKGNLSLNLFRNKLKYILLRDSWYENRQPIQKGKVIIHYVKKINVRNKPSKRYYYPHEQLIAICEPIIKFYQPHMEIVKKEVVYNPNLIYPNILIEIVGYCTKI